MKPQQSGDTQYLQTFLVFAKISRGQSLWVLIGDLDSCPWPVIPWMWPLWWKILN